MTPNLHLNRRADGVQRHIPDRFSPALLAPPSLQYGATLKPSEEAEDLAPSVFNAMWSGHMKTYVGGFRSNIPVRASQMEKFIYYTFLFFPFWKMHHPNPAVTLRYSLHHPNLQCAGFNRLKEEFSGCFLNSKILI